MERTPKDALMERTRTVISRTYSLLEEPYDDELKDPLRDPDKAFGDLEEREYRAELELVDRYQAFVAELLRLSLAGIAVFGFLYEYLISSTNVLANVLAAFGVLMFGISAASALVFRFFASEGARFYIEALRRFSRANAGREQKERAKKSLDIRDEKVRICRTSKGIAAVTLALGGVLEAFAFFLLLIVR
jgi:hypothetical protein